MGGPWAADVLSLPLKIDEKSEGFGWSASRELDPFLLNIFEGYKARMMGEGKWTMVRVLWDLVVGDGSGGDERELTLLSTSSRSRTKAKSHTTARR
jgi:hypothetical protein